MQYKLEKITFDVIKPVWEEHLWSSRESPIKTHSSMTLPFDNDVDFDMQIYNYPATYWALFFDNEIVGVNSGHKTSDNQYRSRGLWVDEKFRKNGLGQLLLNQVVNQACIEKCNIVWSIPRLSAFSTYEKVGFIQFGSIFKTETSDANVYAIKHIKEYT